MLWVVMDRARRIRENEMAPCGGCHRVTNTIRGSCPECGYTKDDTWLPEPQRDRLRSLWPDDWAAKLFLALVFALLGLIIQQLL